jgi:hypothetical protein
MPFWPYLGSDRLASALSASTGGAVHPIDGRLSALNSQADPI